MELEIGNSEQGIENRLFLCFLFNYFKKLLSILLFILTKIKETKGGFTFP